MTVKTIKGDSNTYLKRVIKKHKLVPLKLTDKRVKPLLDIVRGWKGNRISQIKTSGSSAKGTGLKGSADLDIFISFKASTNDSLGGLYDSLYAELGKHTKLLNLRRRKQNVSVRVSYNQLKIDLVPAKKMGNSHTLHSLHVNREKKQWTQTNIDKHIAYVVGSGRVNEIVLMKVWRKRNGLDFPSIYLEMVVIQSLKGKGKSNLGRNMHRVFEYLGSGSFEKDTYIDPSNGSNIISKTNTKLSKKKIAIAARQTLKCLPNWQLVFGRV